MISRETPVDPSSTTTRSEQWCLPLHSRHLTNLVRSMETTTGMYQKCSTFPKKLVESNIVDMNNIYICYVTFAFLIYI